MKKNITPKEIYYEHTLIKLPNGELVKPEKRDCDNYLLDEIEKKAKEILDKEFDKNKHKKVFADLVVFGQAKLLILIFCFLASITFAQPPTGKTKKLSSNEIVLAEAIKCMGKRIDGGVCNEFVTHCLTKSDRNWRKKVHFGKKKLLRSKAKFSYGKERKKNSYIEVGDVILFYKVSNDEYEMDAHVAIVKEILTDHSIMILDQNSDERVGKKSRVGEWVFDFDKWTINGFIKVFQPY